MTLDQELRVKALELALQFRAVGRGDVLATAQRYYEFMRNNTKETK